MIAVAMGYDDVVHLLRGHAAAAAEVTLIRRLDAPKVCQQCTVGRPVMVRAWSHAGIHQDVIPDAV